MVNINIQKKDLWLLSAIMVFLVGVGFVISYNPSGTGGTPSIMGHSADEIEGGSGISGCSGTLQWIYMTDDEVDSYGPFAGTGCWGSGCPNYDTCPGNDMGFPYYCSALDDFTCIDQRFITTETPNQQKRTITCIPVQALRCV